MGFCWLALQPVMGGGAETPEQLSEVQAGLEDRLGPRPRARGWQPQIIQFLQK